MSPNTNLTSTWYETEIGHEIVKKKYLHEGEEDAVDLAMRVSSVFKDQEFANVIGQGILSADFFPAGRALYAAGSEGKFKASYSNCYILPMPEDSIESINEVAGKAARIYSYGG